MYLANFYLLFWEFNFLRDALQVFSASADQLQRAAIRQAILAFHFVSRYADDAAIINRLPAYHVESLFYVDQVCHGVHGIYPSGLRLHSSTIEPARVLHILDIQVLPAHEVSGPLITRLYDKRWSPQYAHIAVVMRFPAADSMLAWSCKLNVFDAQFVHFSRIITDGDNFRCEVGRLLVDMISARYPHMPLFRRCRRRCNITPVLFGMARGTATPVVGLPPWGLFAQIKADVMSALPQIANQ